MALTHLSVRVANPARPRRFVRVKFLVDSGAIHSVVPTRTLERLGVKAHSRRTFILADGPIYGIPTATAAPLEGGGHVRRIPPRPWCGHQNAGARTMRDRRDQQAWRDSSKPRFPISTHCER
jgi:hypothetical protein